MSRGHNRIEYYFALDAAKHIAMMSLKKRKLEKAYLAVFGADLKFKVSEYRDPTGRKLPEILLNKSVSWKKPIFKRMEIKEIFPRPRM